MTPRGGAPLVLVIGTIGNPNILPAGRGLVVGFKDPDLLPPTRKPVQARVRITAPVTLAQLRRTPVSLVVSGGTTGAQRAWRSSRGRHRARDQRLLGLADHSRSKARMPDKRIVGLAVATAQPWIVATFCCIATEPSLGLGTVASYRHGGGRAIPGERTMAKPNVHTASRDELVDAGVRAELADEILKRRRKGAIRLEALEEVSGVGPATLEQLRQALDFREPPHAAAPSGGHGGRANEQQQRPQPDDRNRVREGGGGSEERRREEEATARTAEAARLGVKVARDTTAAVAETATEAAAEAARGGLQVVRRTSAAADQATRRSAEGTAELGQGLTELVHQQTRHNAATLLALSETVDWERWFRIQGEYLHASLERVAGLAQRYLDASQAVLTAAAKVGAAGGRRNRGGSEAA
jgi:hypothetical protein